MLTFYAKARREDVPAHILKQLKEAFAHGKEACGTRPHEIRSRARYLAGSPGRRAGNQGGRRAVVEPRSPIVRARLRAGLTQAQFAVLLGVSRRTLEQWEQGRRAPSGAAKTLIKVAVMHPEVLRKIAA